MTKDYAKKRRSHYGTKAKGRHAHFHSRQHSVRFPWIGTILGLILGLSICTAIYFRYPLFPKLFTLHKTTHPKSQVAQNKVPERRFDFYTVLPNMDFDDSSVEAVAVAKTKPQTTIAASEKHNPVKADPYIVQLGSFRSLSQAERLKAELALAGKEARIQTFNMGGRDTWYRVYVGPFPNKETALQTINDLQHTQVRHSLVLKNSV